MKKVALVVGARPNFMKIAPIIDAMLAQPELGLSFRLIHTGQHFDEKMSDTFFKELQIPHPDVNLNCGGGTQAEQTAAIMVAFEKELMAHPVDLVLVVGDVTSTMACSIVAKKLGIKVAHVEAGIRSFDLTMPEEINRMVTDSITDYFFTTTTWASDNLLRTGVPDHSVFFVGNVMIDTLLKQMPRFQQPAFWDELNLQPQQYVVVTLHRPANVDDKDKLLQLLSAICHSLEGITVVFPMHPRTAKVFAATQAQFANLQIVEPMGYLAFNYLVQNALGVVTDSGGITEETTVMRIPCITLRDNTERPETVEIGTNELVGTDPSKLPPYLHTLRSHQWKQGQIPELWDGQTAVRILQQLATLL